MKWLKAGRAAQWVLKRTETLEWFDDLCWEVVETAWVMQQLLLMVNVNRSSVSVGVLQGSDLKLWDFLTPCLLLPLLCFLGVACANASYLPLFPWNGDPVCTKYTFLAEVWLCCLRPQRGVMFNFSKCASILSSFIPWTWLSIHSVKRGLPCLTAVTDASHSSDSQLGSKEKWALCADMICIQQKADWRGKVLLPQYYILHHLLQERHKWTSAFCWSSKAHTGPSELRVYPDLSSSSECAQGCSVLPCSSCLGTPCSQGEESRKPQPPAAPSRPSSFHCHAVLYLR